MHIKEFIPSIEHALHQDNIISKEQVVIKYVEAVYPKLKNKISPDFIIISENKITLDFIPPTKYTVLFRKKFYEQFINYYSEHLI